MAPTHEVTNQPPPRGDVNLFAEDRALREAVAREGAAWAEDGLSRLGGEWGRAGTRTLGRLANLHPSLLHAHDFQGQRRDEVEFHPAWHELLGLYAHDDLSRPPRAAPAWWGGAGDGRGMAAAPARAGIRSSLRPGRGQARRAARHAHDREEGRL